MTLFLFASVYSAIRCHAQPVVPKPAFEKFREIKISEPKRSLHGPAHYYEGTTDVNNNSLGANSSDIIRQTILQAQHQMGVSAPGQSADIQQRQMTELNQNLESNSSQSDDYLYLRTLSRFEEYLREFSKLNPDSFSITRAVYLSEAVYYDKPFSYQGFASSIKQIAGCVNQILKQERLSESDNIALNYGIQKLYEQDNVIYNEGLNKEYILKRLKYDFDDYAGEKDWTKMFVTKILETGSGQCHSLPLLYLCVAEQLHARAYLSLAPNHSFIQFFDDKNREYNFETTSGGLVTTAWMMQSTAISATAYKNKTYLDTLSSRKLYAQCLADFQMAYLAKNGYDNFSQTLTQKILAIDSSNIDALMTQNNYAYWVFKDIQMKCGNPPKEKWAGYPQLQSAYDDLSEKAEKIKRLGFQQMPPEQYRQWLQSIEVEKKKERYKETQECIQREVRRLKQKKSKLSNSQLK